MSSPAPLSSGSLGSEKLSRRKCSSVVPLIGGCKTCFDVLIHMAPSAFQQHGNAWIDHAVDCLKPIATLANYADLSKSLQLVRHRLNRHPAFIREISHAEFVHPD